MICIWWQTIFSTYTGSTWTHMVQKDRAYSFHLCHRNSAHVLWSHTKTHTFVLRSYGIVMILKIDGMWCISVDEVPLPAAWLNQILVIHWFIEPSTAWNCRYSYQWQVVTSLFHIIAHLHHFGTTTDITLIKTDYFHTNIHAICQISSILFCT